MDFGSNLVVMMTARKCYRYRQDIFYITSGICITSNKIRQTCINYSIHSAENTHSNVCICICKCNEDSNIENCLFEVRPDASHLLVVIKSERHSMSGLFVWLSVSILRQGKYECPPRPRLSDIQNMLHGTITTQSQCDNNTTSDCSKSREDDS